MTPLSPLRVRPRVPSPKLPPACADTNSGISRRGKLISRPDNVPGVRPIQPRNPKQSSAIVKKSPRSTSPTSQHHSCIHDVPAVRVCRITRVGHELRPPRNDGHSDVLGGRGGARSDEIFQRRNAAGIRTRRRECLAPTARSWPGLQQHERAPASAPCKPQCEQHKRHCAHWRGPMWAAPRVRHVRHWHATRWTRAARGRTTYLQCRGILYCAQYKHHSLLRFYLVLGVLRFCIYGGARCGGARGPRGQKLQSRVR